MYNNVDVIDMRGEDEWVEGFGVVRLQEDQHNNVVAEVPLAFDSLEVLSGSG